MARGEDDGGVVGEIDVLRPEFLGGKRFDEEEGLEVQLRSELLLQDLVGCEIGRELLGYQDLHLAAKLIKKT